MKNQGVSTGGRASRGPGRGSDRPTSCTRNLAEIDSSFLARLRHGSQCATAELAHALMALYGGLRLLKRRGCDRSQPLSCSLRLARRVERKMPAVVCIAHQHAAARLVRVR